MTTRDPRSDGSAAGDVITNHVTPGAPPGPDLCPDPGCPRCRSQRTVSYGARFGCCQCGATWQAAR